MKKFFINQDFSEYFVKKNDFKLKPKDNLSFFYQIIFVFFWLFISSCHLLPFLLPPSPINNYYKNNWDWVNNFIYILFLVFSLYWAVKIKDIKLIVRFLPLVFYVFIKIFINNIIGSFFLGSWDEKNALYFFNFLFNNQKNILALENSERVIKFIILDFFNSLFKILFIVFYVFLNLENIYNFFKKVRYDYEKFIFFFIWLIAVFFWILYRNNATSFSENQDTENQKNIGLIYKYSSSLNFFLLYLNIVFFGPIWEESVFRYGLFSFFQKNQYFWASLLSIFCFAVIHFRHEDLLKIKSFEDFFKSDLKGYIYGALFIVTTYSIFSWQLFFVIFFHSYWNFSVI